MADAKFINGESMLPDRELVEIVESVFEIKLRIQPFLAQHVFEKQPGNRKFPRDLAGAFFKIHR